MKDNTTFVTPFVRERKLIETEKALLSFIYINFLYISLFLLENFSNIYWM